jgi:hypothetical protein
VVLVGPVSSAPLSPRSEAVRSFVASFYAAHGYGPTYREIGEAAGISSTSR